MTTFCDEKAEIPENIQDAVEALHSLPQEWRRAVGKALHKAAAEVVVADPGRAAEFHSAAEFVWPMHEEFSWSRRQP